MVAEKCMEGVWKAQSECLDQGECAAASVENALCGQEQRICDATCHWGEWKELKTGTAECTAGEKRPVKGDCAADLVRKEKCSEECKWVLDETSECFNPCAHVTRRTTPADAEEICIPAGPFIRGAEKDPYATPVREVMLSGYFIDRYPVTNERYFACIKASQCTYPGDQFSKEWVARSDYKDHSVRGLTWEQARAFCSWDGGRRLPTEAEWEKAARGPAPRTNLYPWDGESFRCDLLCAPQICSDCQVGITESVSSWPGARSYYGIEGTLGGPIQWLSDIFSEYYYEDNTSLVDPQGSDPLAPGASEYHSLRGRFRDYVREGDHITSRYGGPSRSDASAQVAAVRCARDLKE
jgi:iron(II)-dependent oxidoreductase